MGIDGGLRSLLRERIRLAHWQSIETGGTGLGIPDTNGCLCGVEVWVELKQTEAWSVSFRPGQIAWLEQRARAGGRTFLMVRRCHQGGPRRGPSVDEVWLFPGTEARHVAAHGLRGSAVPILRGDGGPAKWSWREITRALFTQ